MERKEFLKRSLSGLGVLMTIPGLSRCGNDDVEPATWTSTEGSDNGSSADNCTVTNSETEGPYPIHEPSSLVKADIRGDRAGVTLTVNITIRNKNTGCEAVDAAKVDIWHCDALGQYSEYGSLTSVSWLRGRQTTDADGLTSFTSIFPGWYSGRSPHIHVHVYDSAGRSLLVTQIAFPDDLCRTVYTSASDYISHGVHDTLLASDSVFRDGYDNELASFDGSVADGYTLTHTIVVSA